MNLYTSLVHLHLDYACVVWCPFQLGDMQVRTIENVHRYATKIALSLEDKPIMYDRLASST